MWYSFSPWRVYPLRRNRNKTSFWNIVLSSLRIRPGVAIFFAAAIICIFNYSATVQNEVSPVSDSSQCNNAVETLTCLDRVVITFPNPVELGYHLHLLVDDKIVIEGQCVVLPTNESAPIVSERINPRAVITGTLIGQSSGLPFMCTSAGVELVSSPKQVQLEAHSSTTSSSSPWTLHFSSNSLHYTTFAPNGILCPPQCREALVVIEDFQREKKDAKHTPPPFQMGVQPWEFRRMQASVVASAWLQRGSGVRPNQQPGLEPAYRHMASVARMLNGTLVAAWQASNIGEGKSDMHVRLSYSLDDRGRHWGPSIKVPHHKGHIGPRGSPVVHVDGRGAVWVFFTQSISSLCHAPGGDIWVVVWSPSSGDITFSSSSASGSWSLPHLLLGAQHGGLVNKVLAGRVVVLNSGEWVLPYWREKGNCDTPTKVYAGLLISADDGATWHTRGQVGADLNVQSALLEVSVVETVPGTLYMLARSASEVLYASLSRDWGNTWTKARPLRGFPPPFNKPKVGVTADLPEVVGKPVLIELVPRVRGDVEGSTDLRRVRRGPLLMAVNEASRKSCEMCRSHLSLLVSTDQAHSWQRLLELENEELPGLRHHYPSLLQLPSSRDKFRIMIVYSTFFMSSFPRIHGHPEGLQVKTVELFLQNVTESRSNKVYIEEDD